MRVLPPLIMGGAVRLKSLQEVSRPRPFSQKKRGLETRQNERESSKVPLKEHVSLKPVTSCKRSLLYPTLRTYVFTSITIQKKRPGNMLITKTS